MELDRDAVAGNDEQIELLEQTIRELEDGTFRSHDHGGDVTQEAVRRNRQGIESLVDANRIMRQTQSELLEPYGAAAGLSNVMRL